MKLRYIGDDKVYGLQTDKIYNVEIFSKGSLIFVNVEGIPFGCPYATPNALAHNWQHV